MRDERNRIRIPFHLHPYEFEKGMHAVEKADSEGIKRRYLKGISSGMKIDGHGERMTDRCIKSMLNQANVGSILLYEGQHGVNYTDDIGILTGSEITPMGDWLTTFRLYDENDGFDRGCKTLEKANKLWKQVNGMPPYVDEEGKAKPLQKGFSVEGYIPDGGILEMSDTGQRVIDNVELDGVVVTPRPAYKDSIITAVYKALDELPPDKKIVISENIRGKFINKLEEEQKKQNYYAKRFKLEDALNESIEEIMQHNIQVRDRLNLLLDEYKTMLIELIMAHEGIFVRPEVLSVSQIETVDVAKMERVRLLKSIEGQLKGFIDVKSRIAKTKERRNDKRTKRPWAGRKIPN